MNSLYGHTWCDCLECDLTVEAMSVLVIEHRNRDADLGMALVHFAHTNDTSYNVFGEMYLICNRFGDILDPMWYDDDDDPYEPEDYPSIGYWDLGEADDFDGSQILQLL